MDDSTDDRDPKLAALIASVRRRCKPGLWSQAVTLARAGAVTIESRTAEEIVARVRSPGRIVAPTAVLYPTENETECDCPSRMNPCEHVAAVAIALSGGGADAAAGTGAGAADVAGGAGAVAVVARPALERVGYRFTRVDDGLRLARVLIAADGGETPLTEELASVLADPARAARLQVEAADLTVDRLLGAGAAARRGPLQPTKVDALMGILAGAPRLTLDGVAVVISEEEVRPVATLSDRTPHPNPLPRFAGRGDRDNDLLVISADPRVRQVVAGGIVLCDDDDGRATLHRLVETEMTGLRLQNLPIRRSFSGAEMGELVTVVLPDLARRAVVDIQSNRLPPVARDLAPRVVLDLDQIEGGLSVLPTLVYGAPPVARIDAGKLVYLRGPVPLRDVPAEQRVVERLRTELDLVVGRRTSFDPRDAPRFVEKLKRWRGDLAGRAAGVVKPASTLVPRLRVIAGGPHPGPLPQAGEGEGALDVRFELTFEVRDARGNASEAKAVDAAAVVRAWQEGLGLVPLVERRLGAAAARRGWRSTAQRVADLLAAREDGRAAGATTRCPRWRRCATRWSTRRRPGWTGWRRCVGGLRTPARGAAAAPISPPRCAPTSGRASAGSPSCAAPAWAASSRTTWAWARRCRRDLRACARVHRTARRWWCARPACCPTGQARAEALPPGPAASPSTTGRARARRDRRRDAHHLRDPAPGRGGAGGAQLGTRWCWTRRRPSRTRTARWRARRTRCRRASAWR